MGKFKYVAVDNHGVYIRGSLEAPTLPAAVEMLREKNLWPVRCFDLGNSILYKEITFGGPKVKSEHFTVFCRQLATLYVSGVNLVESVRILSEQAGTRAFKKVLISVADEMNKGAQLSDAAAAYPTVFSQVFVNMVKAGETSGNLDEMLSRLAVFYEKEHFTREKVKSAMVYPVIMSIVTVLVVTLMMIFVIPRYVSNFESLGMELPLPTRIVIGISEFFQQYWYVVIGSLFLPTLLAAVIKRLPKGPYVLDYIKLKVPVFGKLRQKQALARFSRVFSSLYGAAIPMLQALSIVAGVVGNEVVRKVIADSRESVRSGQSIADPFKRSWVFPPMIVQMLAIGERTGAIDTMLEKVADFYEQDVDQTTERLKSALEPLMIVALSGIVGGIVSAVMLPTFKLLQNF